MKRVIILMIVALLSTLTLWSQPRKLKKISRYMQQATAKDLAGVAVYIHDPKLGQQTMAAGYADIENKIPLRKDHIFAMGSIGKMYNAVAAMKLAEENRLKLDDKINQYLSPDIVYKLPAGADITIRHLLGQTSGLVNYDTDPELNRLYLTGQLKLDTVSKREILERYVFGKPARNKPGEAYHYSSTNYLLLAMVMDAVLPEGHTHYLRAMLKQHGYNNTWYRQTPPNHTINYYGDPNQDAHIDNLTDETLETTNWFTGDDGVYAPIEEAALFLENLMHGKILTEKSLKEMMTWNDPKSPDYGLGLMAGSGFPYKLLLGHSGRGIGMTTDLYYFPRQQRTIAIFCNTGLRSSLPKVKKTYFKMRTGIVKRLFIF
jgi:D-alanyl-D-alanine carboxypeptidase